MAYNKMSEDPLFNGQGFTRPSENAENKRIKKTNPELNQIFESIQDPDENERINEFYGPEEVNPD